MNVVLSRRKGARHVRPNHDTYSAFCAEMATLTEHLTHLRAMLAHEDEVALDELADALAIAFHSHPSEYHHVEQHGPKR